MIPLRLETDRLILRPFREEDLSVFAEYRSDPEVARYQSWSTPYTMDQAQHFYSSVRRMRPGDPGWYQVAIERKETADMIGDVAFCIHQVPTPSAEIGYTLAGAHHGSGYATEAVVMLLEYLFEERGVLRARANCDTRNTRSSRLLERLGFATDGPAERVRFKGEWCLEQWYSLTATSGYWPRS